MSCVWCTRCSNSVASPTAAAATACCHVASRTCQEDTINGQSLFIDHSSCNPCIWLDWVFLYGVQAVVVVVCGSVVVLPLDSCLLVWHGGTVVMMCVGVAFWKLPVQSLAIPLFVATLNNSFTLVPLFMKQHKLVLARWLFKAGKVTSRTWQKVMATFRWVYGCLPSNRR